MRPLQAPRRRKPTTWRPAMVCSAQPHRVRRASWNWDSCTTATLAPTPTPPTRKPLATTTVAPGLQAAEARSRRVDHDGWCRPGTIGHVRIFDTRDGRCLAPIVGWPDGGSVDGDAGCLEAGVGPCQSGCGSCVVLTHQMRFGSFHCGTRPLDVDCSSHLCSI